jgi:hypothetical protein
MSSRTPNMRKLEQLLEHLEQEIEAKRQQAEGIRMALKALNGELPLPTPSRSGGVKPNVKKTLLTLLDEVGEAGLNAASAVEMAAKRGERLERPTVSSLLSRFKADGLVSYDNVVYRLLPAGKGATTSDEGDTDRVH